MKLRFRDKLANLKVNNQIYQIDALIEEVENSISGATVIACARSGWKHILQNMQGEQINVFQTV